MQLFIANTTKQRKIISFRVIETGLLRQYPLEPGMQRMVMDGNSDEIEAIVNHYSAYGMVEASRIDQAKEFIGMIYSVDKPVTGVKIEKGLRDNDNYLTKESFERRQAATAALDTSLNESGIGYKGDVEISAEQQVNKNDPDDEQKINETIKSDRRGPGRPRKE